MVAAAGLVAVERLELHGRVIDAEALAEIAAARAIEIAQPELATAYHTSIELADAAVRPASRAQSR